MACTRRTGNARPGPSQTRHADSTRPGQSDTRRTPTPRPPAARGPRPSASRPTPVPPAAPGPHLAAVPVQSRPAPLRARPAPDRSRRQRSARARLTPAGRPGSAPGNRRAARQPPASGSGAVPACAPRAGPSRPAPPPEAQAAQDRTTPDRPAAGTGRTAPAGTLSVPRMPGRPAPQPPQTKPRPQPAAGRGCRAWRRVHRHRPPDRRALAGGLRRSRIGRAIPRDRGRRECPGLRGRRVHLHRPPRAGPHPAR